MARHSFIQMSKLSNVKGRISYISDPKRQEYFSDLLLHHHVLLIVKRASSRLSSAKGVPSNMPRITQSRSS